MKWVKIFDEVKYAVNKVPPNRAILIKIGSKRLSLSRYQDTFYATDDHCPHNGENLNKGNVNILGEIVCPWHNYRYNLKNGRECQERTKDLKTYPVEVNENGIFIALNDE